MGTHRGFRRIPFLAFGLILAAASCSTVSDVIVDDIGTTQLYFLDTNLQAQSASNPGSTIQSVGLVVSYAHLLIRDQDEDLMFGGLCDFGDSFRTLTSTFGPCGSGIVIDADEDNPVAVSVRLVGEITVVRATPPPARFDYDADGIANDLDVCPFVPDPDQLDSNDDGIGNACTVASNGIAYLDSDGDGVRDSTDNCAWRYNPDQEDVGGELKSINANLTDGVGDACHEDFVTINLGSDAVQFELGPVDLAQPKNGRSYLTVDLNSDESLTCDFDAGTCTFDPSKIRFCANTSLAAAVNGCADSE